jgi:predicted metal-dependent phosphotriesterase family hydrolase
LLLQGLKQEGVSDAELDRMMRKNPARLLGLGS